MQQIILVAETGSDINRDLAAQYGIEIVPMHVSFGDEPLADGTFPAERILTYYHSTGKLPKTSGSTPGDFAQIFDAIHAREPQAQILYLAYSAVTTCSYQSAVIAAEGREYVTMLDTKQVSVGQCNVVIAVAEKLRENPQMTMDEAVAYAKGLIERARMCFLPDNLDFLRAGGRVSNAAYLGTRILSLHPCIEILEGKLIATKKYRGKMTKVADRAVRDYARAYRLQKDRLWFVYTIGLSDAVKASAEAAARDCGFRELRWVQAGGVITTHGGPATFGLAGFSEE